MTASERGLLAQWHPPVDEIDGVRVQGLKRRDDTRGWLLELFRSDELPTGFLPAMAYFSQTMPGVIRGPHEHVEQTDYFVFAGPGEFRLFLWDRRELSPTFGRHEQWTVGESLPTAVTVPPGVVHAYKNVGLVPGLVFNAPDRLYCGPGRNDPVDEIRWELRSDSPYVID